MIKKPTLLYKTLVIGIIILFIGMSVVSSNGNIVDNIPSYTQILNEVDNSQELLSRGKIAYAYVAYSGSSGHPEGPCYFPLYEPSNITSLGSTQSGNFLTGGTWTCDDRWFGIEYMTGIIWEINPDTGDMWSIGGGGSSCSDLSYNPVNKKLYSVCCSAIYELNITTGEQYLICDLSIGPNCLIGIAFDKNGILYGWDHSSLWIIDIETCQATLVGGFGFNYINNGHFDLDTNKFYVTAYFTTGQLYEVDIKTGVCYLIGNFQGGAELTALAISFDCLNQPPSAPKIDGASIGKPGEEYCITVNSTDPDGNILFYYIDWGDGIYEDWFGPYEPGVNITKCHSYPPITKLYEIQVKAKDIHGAESGWGKMYVFIFRSRMQDNLFFLRLLERLPMLERLLSLIRIC